ncbi:MAG: hypothetical protein ACLPQS_17535 [Acidimicrobiales bacterium]
MAASARDGSPDSSGLSWREWYGGDAKWVLCFYVASALFLGCDIAIFGLMWAWWDNVNAPSTGLPADIVNGGPIIIGLGFWVEVALAYAAAGAIRSLASSRRRIAVRSVIGAGLAIQAGSFALYLYLFALAWKHVSF